MGFGDPNNLGIVQYHKFERNTKYALTTWHVGSEYAIQIPDNGVYIVTAQTSWNAEKNLKSVRSAIYTGATVESIANGDDGRCLNISHWYTSNGGKDFRGDKQCFSYAKNI